ncbi:hypothetical protein BJ875DRAFT_436571 [Amylocarpus encephaloides]|uniref:Uncharacterized protein n=1 Tax=Amylocarpus encephaloides TaxID=45428 RepID=A0A9P7YTB2_9HELO|nr:hypothetical protein BJ875DRAFT_436571 [Amylocarpus encephaloides]
MVFANSEDGGVKVSLRRIEEGRKRFREYASPVRDTLKRFTRYIAGEAVRYGIEVTFQRGFILGRANGVLGIVITDKNSDTHLIDDIFEFDYTQEKLPADRTFHFDKIPQGFVGGQLREDVLMAFNALIPDQSSPTDHGMTTIESDIGCIKIKITRHQRMRDISMRDEEQLLQNESTWAQFEAGETLDAVRTIERASYYGQGITHSTSLEGGIPVELRVWDPEKSYFTSEKPWSLTFNYIYRSRAYKSPEYLKSSKIIEHNEWRSFNEAQRAEAFTELQEFDKKHTTQLVMREAGALADEENICRKSIFGTGMVPDQYRKYNSLTVPEKEVVYSLLKFRRSFLQNSRIPPYKPRDPNPADKYVEDVVQYRLPILNLKRVKCTSDQVSNSDSEPLMAKRKRSLIKDDSSLTSSSDEEPLMSKRKRFLKEDSRLTSAPDDEPFMARKSNLGD